MLAATFVLLSTLESKKYKLDPSGILDVVRVTMPPSPLTDITLSYDARISIQLFIFEAGSSARINVFSISVLTATSPFIAPDVSMSVSLVTTYTLFIIKLGN